MRWPWYKDVFDFFQQHFDAIENDMEDITVEEV
jgi:hypothetical protein